MASKSYRINERLKREYRELIRQLEAHRDHQLRTYGKVAESTLIAIKWNKEKLDQLPHVLEPKDCGFHYGTEPGPCSKCAADPAVAAIARRAIADGIESEEVDLGAPAELRCGCSDLEFCDEHKR